MTCTICGEVSDDPSEHARHMALMHPEVLVEQHTAELQEELLRPVTSEMDDEDWICEECNTQFRLGMLYGEVSEGMFGGMPIISFLCGPCYMERLGL